MKKLTRADAVSIIVGVWLSAFLAATFITTGDWARALGGSVWFLILGWGIVGSINGRADRSAQSP